MSLAAEWTLKHRATLEKALEVCRTRAAWSPFVESPSAKLHPEGHPAQGKARFEAHLNTPFDLDQPGTIGRTGFEISPYTQTPLGIDYPRPDPDQLFSHALKAVPAWLAAGTEHRAAVLLEMAFRFEAQAFENAWATMHTAGQSYLMAYSGSGPNAIDRGVEALAYAVKALRDVPEQAVWSKDFGRGGRVTLDKRYEIRPRGVAVIVCCATFPMWNAYPALFANLMTGNPTILKPHPNGILPVAIAVKTARMVLKEAGFDENLVTLAADTVDQPVAIELMDHPSCAIIDYTGSQRFGHIIEERYARKLVYTETAGCNAVVLHSTNNLADMIDALANGLCAFSAQMCTSPQNIHIPAGGITSDEGVIAPERFAERLVAAIDARVATPERAAALCATIQSPATLGLLDELEASAGTNAHVLRRSRPYAHLEFQTARTATPLVIGCGPERLDLYGEEHFGPVSFLITEPSASRALERAAEIAETRGAISSYLYSTDEAFIAEAEARFARAGASLWVNMPSAMPMNFAAAYSDYHVTGLNPSGNACLTDLAFVTSRFRIVQFRRPVEGPKP
jgi:phenylacetic acid degradation protein paaN